MTKSISSAMLSGAIGAVGLAAIQQGAYAADLDETPMATALATKVLKLDEKSAPLAGGALFLVAGAAWGALYALTNSKRNVKSGLLFSILPSLFVMLVNYPTLGKPLFGGGKPKAILLPFLLNAVWGAFVGARSANS